MQRVELLMRCCADMAVSLRKLVESPLEAFSIAFEIYERQARFADIDTKDALFGVGRDLIAAAAGVESLKQ